MKQGNPQQAGDAYCAGVVDADGCISISDAYVRVQVTSADIRMCNFFEDRFGGSIYSYKGHNNAGRLVYCWQVSGRTAFEILTAIEPYLVLKRKKAQACLHALQIRDRAERRRYLREHVLYADPSAAATTKWSDTLEGTNHE